MRTILYILQKEFIQIRRNKSMLPIIFVMPIIQLLILANAATFELKHARMYIVDRDLSSTSRQLTNKFDASPFFNIVNSSFSETDAGEALNKDKADIVLKIPYGFEKKLRNEGSGKIQLAINAINAMSAGLIQAYTTSIIADYNKQVITNWTSISGKQVAPLQTTYSFWYNPELNYLNYMVPGILVLLVTMIGMFLSGMNIVREKELGTIEQINITPIKKYQFIIGKLLPFWIIALFELAFGMTLGKLVFNIPIVGSIGLIFLFAAVYLLVVLSFGLFISTINRTQQQALFVSFFFMMVFIMMSGLFTPVDSMPDWAKMINIINPVAYFIKAMRMVLLKGSGFDDIKNIFYSISVYAFVMINLAVFRYRKVS